jgi:hypothetical protein
MSREWNQWEDLSIEEEMKLIERMSNYLVRHNLGTLAKMTLESGGSLTSLFAEFYMGLYGPYFDFLYIDKYVALLRKKQNSKRLIERIEALEAQLEEKKRAAKEAKRLQASAGGSSSLS